MVRILAFLDPECIPLDLLIDGSVQLKNNPEGRKIWRTYVVGIEQPWEGAETSRTNPAPENLRSLEDTQSVVDALSDKTSRDFLVDEILSTSLVGKRTYDGMPSLRMHELVREKLMEDTMLKGRSVILFGEAVALMFGALLSIKAPFDKPKTWRKCGLLTPHFRRLVELSKTYSIKDEQLSDAYSRLGLYYYSTGQWEEAQMCYEWCLSCPPPGAVLQITGRLARTLLKRDKFEAAKDYLEPLFETTDAGVILPNLENMREAAILANCYYLQAHLVKAIALYQSILKLGITERPDEEYEQAKIFEGLANAYSRSGMPEDAGIYYEKCLTYRKKELGSQYVSMLRTLFNQARLQRDNGDLQGAAKAFEAILEDYKITVGQDHPDALLVAGRLAYLYARQRKYDWAWQLATDTLERQKKQVLQQPVAICYTQWTLADISAHRDDHEAAEKLFKAALDGYEKYIGAEHPFTLYVRRDFSDWYQKRNRVSEAVQVLEVALPYIKGSAAAAKLARLYDWQERYPEAEDLAKQTYEKQKNSIGSKSSDTNYTLWVLARIYDHEGQHQLARDYYQMAWDGYQRIPGAVFGGLTEMGREFEEFLLANNDHAKAREVREQLQRAAPQVRERRAFSNALAGLPQERRPRETVPMESLPLQTFDEDVPENH